MQAADFHQVSCTATRTNMGTPGSIFRTRHAPDIKMMSEGRPTKSCRERDVPVSPFVAKAARKAIGRRRILDGRGFLPVPVTTFALHACAWCRRGGTRAMERSKRGDTMRRQLTAAVSFAFVAADRKSVV